jgi:hypothetical protein
MRHQSGEVRHGSKPGAVIDKHIVLGEDVIKHKYGDSVEDKYGACPHEMMKLWFVIPCHQHNDGGNE